MLQMFMQIYIFMNISKEIESIKALFFQPLIVINIMVQYFCILVYTFCTLLHI